MPVWQHVLLNLLAILSLLLVPYVLLALGLSLAYAWTALRRRRRRRGPQEPEQGRDKPGGMKLAA